MPCTLKKGNGRDLQKRLAEVLAHAGTDAARIYIRKMPDFICGKYNCGSGDGAEHCIFISMCSKHGRIRNESIDCQ